jgi:hypothetical protein
LVQLPLAVMASMGGPYWHLAWMGLSLSLVGVGRAQFESALCGLVTFEKALLELWV